MIIAYEELKKKLVNNKTKGLCGCHQGIIGADMFSKSHFFAVRGIYRWSDGGEGNNYNETTINAEFLTVTFSILFNSSCLKPCP